MKTLIILVRRNIKIFFKDKGTFFSALIAPLILLILFVTFLGNVYRDSFYGCLPEGVDISEKLVNGFVGGWLLSSLLAVCCVSVAFCANMQMVQDKTTGAINDFVVTPCKKSVLSLSYYIATAIVTAAICYIALAAGFIYMGCVGWYLSVADVFLLILDVFLLSMFGTALSSVVCYFLKSQGGITAVSVIVSSIYGFICGAYMPISSFSGGIQKFVMFLPGTYGTGLFRNHFLNGVLAETGKIFPADVINSIGDGFDRNMYFFGNGVSIGCMYLIVVLAVAVLIGAYILLNVFRKKKKD